MGSVDEKLKTIGGFITHAPQTNLLDDMKLLKEMQDQTGLFLLPFLMELFSIPAMHFLIEKFSICLGCRGPEGYKLRAMARLCWSACFLAAYGQSCLLLSSGT